MVRQAIRLMSILTGKLPAMREILASLAHQRAQFRCSDLQTTPNKERPDGSELSNISGYGVLTVPCIWCCHPAVGV